MALIDRVKNIIVTPRTEWPVIAAEPATVGSLYTGYIMILAAIGPIALAIRLAAVGLGLGIASVIVQYLLALAMTYVVALIVDALAPTFGGERSFVQSLKLTAYAMTPGWVAGVFNLLGTAGGFLALILNKTSFLEVSSGPCYAVIEPGLSSTRKQFVYFCLRKVKLSG